MFFGGPGLWLTEAYVAVLSSRRSAREKGLWLRSYSRPEADRIWGIEGI